MPTYDFRSLSPVDFEHVVRDLLSAEWGVHVESFTAGPDGGVDLRCTDPDGRATVVQCKHYPNTRFSGLVAAARKEAPKVAALAPDRYVFVTSQGLTPPNKAELQEAVDRPTEVLGRDDLNAMLGRHPKVERRSVKLWLTSTEVLDRVLHADLFARSALTEDRLPETLRLYVQGAAHREARSILDDLHYCVIAGVPGIGKTTLAQVLCAELVADGYELVHVRGHVAEALRALRPGRKQVVYYDDFLGQTALRSKLEKNEEADLLDLIHAVERSEHARFVLTTREYILNQAKRDYERLASSEFDWRRCTVDLASYSRYNRAEILYNHLYFAELPPPYLNAIHADRAYLRVVDHPGYNPRIVSWMTTQLRRDSVTPDQYAAEFVRTLDDPDRLWRHAFDHQISEPARALLLVLTTLPDRTDVVRARGAFDAFYDARSETYRWPRSPSDFDDALHDLDGTFVATQREDRGHPEMVVVSLHSPSVRDFLEARLRSAPRAAAALADSVTTFEQARFLHSGAYAPPSATWPALTRTLEAPGAALARVSLDSWFGLGTQWIYGVDLPDRIRYIVAAACAKEESGIKPAAELTLAAAFETLFAASRPAPYALSDLTATVVARPPVDVAYGDALRLFAHERLANQVGDLDSLRRYLDYYADHVEGRRFGDLEWEPSDEDIEVQETHQRVRDGYERDIGSDVEWFIENAGESSPEDVEEFDAALADALERLDVPFPEGWGKGLDEAARIAKEVENEDREAYDEGGGGGRRSGPARTSDAHIARMFDSLLDHPGPSEP